MNTTNRRQRSFGELVRIHRMMSWDPNLPYQRLSQERLAELLSLETGFAIGRNTIGKWERELTVIDHQDRQLLISLVTIFYKLGAIRTLSGANEFLESGLYRGLSEDETNKIFEDKKLSINNILQIDSDIHTRASLPNKINSDTQTILSSRIFLSYARDDLGIVQQIYDFLRTAGHNPFIDTQDLLGGENWEKTILGEIEKRDIFIFCISKSSYDRRGMIRKELKRAISVFEGMLPSDIYIIPLRLEECSYPEEIKHIQAIDWFTSSGRVTLLSSINASMERRQRKK